MRHRNVFGTCSILGRDPPALEELTEVVSAQQRRLATMLDDVPPAWVTVVHGFPQPLSSWGRFESCRAHDPLDAPLRLRPSQLELFLRLAPDRSRSSSSFTAAIGKPSRPLSHDRSCLDLAAHGLAASISSTGASVGGRMAGDLPGLAAGVDLLADLEARLDLSRLVAVEHSAEDNSRLAASRPTLPADAPVRTRGRYRRSRLTGRPARSHPRSRSTASSTPTRALLGIRPCMTSATCLRLRANVFLSASRSSCSRRPYNGLHAHRDQLRGSRARCRRAVELLVLSRSGTSSTSTRNPKRDTLLATGSSLRWSAAIELRLRWGRSADRSARRSAEARLRRRPDRVGQPRHRPRRCRGRWTWHERGVLPLVDPDLDAVLLVEPSLEIGRVAAPHGEGAHEGDRARGCGFAPEGGGALGLVGEFGRRARSTRLHLDRLRNREACSGIARPCQPCRSPKPASSWYPQLTTRGSIHSWCSRLRPQEAGALGSAQPLVAVARVHVRPEPREVERDAGPDVRAVDDGENSSAAVRRRRSPRPAARAPSAT